MEHDPTRSETTDKTPVDRDRVEGLINSYWIPGREPIKRADKFLDDVSSLVVPKSPNPFSEVVMALRGNIAAVKDFLELPYSIAHKGLTWVDQKYQLNVSTDEMLDAITHSLTCCLVAPHLERMKQQAVLLLWSAYETFSRDMFMSALNLRPQLYSLLQKSQMKDRYSLNGILSYDNLVQNDFSFQGKFGTLLADGKDFSSPQLLRGLLATIFVFNNASYQERFSKALRAPELWLLGQRRHLVAHRCAVVDQSYLEETGDAGQVIGRPLAITPEELDAAIHAISLASGIALTAAIEACYPDQH